MTRPNTFGHPTDRSPCKICDAKPLFFKPSLVDGVGCCVRCSTPYRHHDEAGDLLPNLQPELFDQLVSLALEVWHQQKLKIHIRPWLPDDWPTVGTVLVVSEFERLARDRRSGWFIDAAETCASVFVVTGEGVRSGFAHVSGPKAFESIGKLVIDSAAYPEGTSVVIYPEKGV